MNGRIFLASVSFFLALVAALTRPSLSQDATDLSPLEDDNLVAWCIVPFDAAKRGPAERAQMLQELGIRRCAYDWRAEHVPTFEQEILEYKKRGIEFFAFWAGHEEAYTLFEKHDIHPQVWRMLGDVGDGSQDEKIETAVKSILPIVERTASLGCKFGLYNHGGWGGEPKNMVAVCRRLNDLGHDHVGIVYNFHHGHGHIADWRESLEILKPYLLCLNLNGMNDRAQPKILGISKGQHERSMIRDIVALGYDGPIGILDHRNELDAKESLQENLDGLRRIRKEMLPKRSDSDAKTSLLIPEMRHLRSGEQREWSEFPEQPDATALTHSFAGTPNETPWTIRIRQHDVKQNWQLSLNGQSLGKLVTDENDLLAYFEIPAGTLAADNSLEIAPAGKHRASDDIRVGEIALVQRSLSDELSRCKLTVRIVDPSNQSLPGRLTLTNQDGSLVTIGTQSNDQMAIRPGVVYSSTGVAELSVPPGAYTVTAGRGFEYSIARWQVDLSVGDEHSVRLAIERVVETDGWVACDTHVHSRTHSGHGDATVDERMITLAGEAIEMPIATDHNVQIDHRPFAANMGVTRYFTPVIGNEVTTKTGHFNIFPVQPGADPPSHNSPQWQETLDGIFATPGVKVAILNHARDVHSGTTPFGPDHFHATAGEMLDDWQVGFNAMEVLNSGATQTDPLQLTRDWMALLNRGRKVTPVGSSDSHDVARYIVGQSRTYVRCDDQQPENIPVEDCVQAFLDGKVSVSYGLFVESQIGDAKSGELARVDGDAVDVDVVVRGPAWVSADRLQLFVNGKESQRMDISPNARQHTAPDEIWRGRVSFDRPAHDVHVVIIASGPGITDPFWNTAKPYQPDSPVWTPRLYACGGAIFVDADEDEKWSSAHDYAKLVMKKSHGDLSNAESLLRKFDESVAIQTALLLHKSGTEPLSLLSPDHGQQRADATSLGFRTYVESWRENQIARLD